MIAWDFEQERRQRRLECVQPLYPRWLRLTVWILCIAVSAGLWGLALSVANWLRR